MSHWLTSAPASDQLLRQVPVGVHDRHEQRRHAVRIRQVDVRAGSSAARPRTPCSSRARRRAAASARRCPGSWDAPRPSRAAGSRGRSSAALTSAPLAMSSCIIAGCRRADAHISGVCPPHFSFASTLAPRSSSSCAASTLPVRATASSAVCRRRWATRRPRPLRAAPSASRCCPLRRPGSSAWRRSCWRAPPWRRRAAGAWPRRRRR